MPYGCHTADINFPVLVSRVPPGPERAVAPSRRSCRRLASAWPPFGNRAIEARSLRIEIQWSGRFESSEGRRAFLRREGTKK